MYDLNAAVKKTLVGKIPCAKSKLLSNEADLETHTSAATCVLS